MAPWYLKHNEILLIIGDSASINLYHLEKEKLREMCVSNIVQTYKYLIYRWHQKAAYLLET